MEEECSNKIFIKNEYSFESDSLLTGIVYVQPDQKYHIKCSHCELSFELIQNFTKHCVESDNCSLELPLPEIDNISENCNDRQEIQEDNLNATNSNLCKTNDSADANDNAVKTESNEISKILEVQVSTEFENESINYGSENIRNDDDNEDEQMEGCQLNEKKTKMLKNLKCEICQKQLMTSSGYLRHMRRGKCEMQMQVKVKNNSWKCAICGKEFTQKRSLVNHELTHQIDIILTCKHCKNEFKGKKNFLAHLKTHSEHGRPHECETCLKKFSTKYDLKRHSFSVHSSEPFYKCNQCSEVFRSSYKLREHKSELHNGQPKHKCQYCPKSFLRFFDLQVHERTHTGEKPYQCEICGRSFAVLNFLTNHTKRHTNERNYKCEICGKCFFTGTYLRDHMVTHTKIKSFSCEICNTRFTLRTALLKHRKLHSGTKEYVCKLCGKAYAQNAGLYKHMKTHKLAQGNL